jgi:hypothetical protein
VTVLLQDIAALLAPLAPAGGIWPLVNTAEPPVFPYITFQRIVSTDNVTMTGPSNLQNTRVQIDVFSLRISEVDAMVTAMDALFLASPIQNVPIAQSDGYEDAVKAYRIMREYSVWATN